MRCCILRSEEFKNQKLHLTGDLLWDPFGGNGGRKLCKYSKDSHDEEKNKGQDDKKQEQAGILIGAV